MNRFVQAIGTETQGQLAILMFPMRLMQTCHAHLQNPFVSYNYYTNLGSSQHGTMHDGYTEPIDTPTFRSIFIY